MAGPILRRRQDSSGCTMSLCEALKTSPGHAGATALAGAACTALTRALAARRGAGAIRSAGWRESVTVTWLSTTTPERRPRCCTALATTFDTIAPFDRRTHGRNRPALARTPAPRTHTAFPSSRGSCPTPSGNLAGQTRSHDGRGLRRLRTLLWNRGPMKKLILVLAACARQGGEHERKPRGSAWREPTPGHMCSCARW